MVAAIPAFLIAIVALAIVAALVAALVKLMWRVAEPDQALIITGLGAGGRDVGSAALGPSSARSRSRTSSASAVASPRRRGSRRRTTWSGSGS